MSCLFLKIKKAPDFNMHQELSYRLPASQQVQLLTNNHKIFN